MTIDGLIDVILEQNPGMIKEDVRKIVRVVFKGTKEVVHRGESLLLPGIGKIYPAFKEGKELWRNPYTKKHVVLDRRIVLKFTAYKKFEDHLTSLMAEEISPEDFGLDESTRV